MVGILSPNLCYIKKKRRKDMRRLIFGMIRLIGSAVCLMPAASCYYLGCERPYEAIMVFLVGFFGFVFFHVISLIFAWKGETYQKEESHIFWNATFIHLLPMIIFGVAMFFVPRHYVFDDWSFWITFIVTVFVHKGINIPGYSLYHLLFGYRCDLIQLYEQRVIFMIHKKNWLTEDNKSNRINRCGDGKGEYFVANSYPVNK